MTTAIKRRRGTTAEHSTFVGLEGEITIDSTKDTVVVHDGSTAGGFPLAKESGSVLSPSSVTLSSGTANGVTYLNGSKVLTSGSALTFDGSTLDVTGTVVSNVITSGRAQFTTSGTPSSGAGVEITYGQEAANTGGILAYNRTAGTYQNIIYNAAAHIHNINGSEQMRLTSTGLGIGTTSPKTTLTVQNGGVTGLSETTFAWQHYQQAASAYTATSIQSVISGASASLTFSTAPNWTNGNAQERMVINSAGLVGIGTSSPGFKLQVSGAQNANDVVITNTTIGSSLRMQMIDAYGAIFTTDSYPLTLGTNGSEKLRLDSSGNLGLGVTPSAWYTADNITRALQISGSGVLVASNDAMRVMQNAFFNTSGAAEYIRSGYAEQYLQNGGQHSWFTAPSGTAGNAISFTQAMTLTAGGNLGIGTSSTSSRVYIAGATDDLLLRIGNTNAVGSQYVSIYANGAEAHYKSVNTQNAVYGSHIWASQNNGGTVERMRIDSAGNVGINTSSPVANLSVRGGTSNASNLSTAYSLAAFNITPKSTSGYSLQFGSGPADLPYIQMSAGGAAAGNLLIQPYGGNVGIGTSTPNFALSFGANIGKTIALFENAGTSVYGIGMGGAGSAGDPYRTKFFSNGSERMAITDAGDVLVGTANAFSQTGKATFASGASGNGLIVQVGNGSTAYQSTNASGTSAYYAAIWSNNGNSFSTCGTIQVSGSNTSYNTSSDYRLKEDVQPITGALAKVALLKPVTYKWKADGTESEGFIAHELAEICPQAVSGEKDALKEDGSIMPQGIDTSFLVATLTAALQEQQAIIESLTARVSALEGN